MIGKVLRGTHAGRLLRYLYGPGRANEHADPHLVAAFTDPASLEPERRPGRAPDLRRLAGLLAQPLAALAGPGYDKPVWHCAVRAAPGDPVLTDAQWAQAATLVMDRTGLAPAGDDQAVRWVAVRHAPDHIHIVVTLARQDGTRPRIWNDFYRVRGACQEAEKLFGLTVTAPADRTAARRPSRAETEQATRRGWAEAPRTRLRREVCGAAAGARTEHEFFARLAGAGVLIRQRHSTINPDQVTGYAVGLPGHTAQDGGTIWYSGGKLAADLTLPKLRTRWASPRTLGDRPAGLDPPAAATRGLLRGIVTTTASQARDEAGFFAQLRLDGVLVRLRFSEQNPGQVTGYAVALPGPDGGTTWIGGGRLAPELSLPRLRRRWQTGAGAGLSGAAGLTGPERNALYDHAARQAAAAAEHIRRHATGNPELAADAAYAAADALHITARVTRSRTLRRAADAYDRAARTPYGRIPGHSTQGNQLRAAARLLALAGQGTGSDLARAGALAMQLTTLVVAVAELRQAQQHATQAAAARTAAEQLHAAQAETLGPAPSFTQAQARRPARPAPAAVADRDRPARSFTRPASTTPSPAHARPHRGPGPQPPRPAGPKR